MREINAILDSLVAQGHTIGDPYIREDERKHSILFLVIDGVAMHVHRARRLENGTATMAELLAEIEVENDAGERKAGGE